jgi:predicted nucleotidyltransferase
LLGLLPPPARLLWLVSRVDVAQPAEPVEPFEDAKGFKAKRTLAVVKDLTLTDGQSGRGHGGGFSIEHSRGLPSNREPSAFDNAIKCGWSTIAVMASKRPSKPASEPWYRGADIPLEVIHDFARRVAERFHPERIILFGSYAYGTPHADSDVDILVVMPARNEIDQSVRIDLACEPCFPLDIIVRTPKNMLWRLEEGDSFLREITSRGKVLYEKADEGVGAKSGGRPRRRPGAQSGKRSSS